MKEQKMPEVALNFTLPETKELLESGVHFGHETKRWNPKMSEYIYTTRGSIHIIDLAKTQVCFARALKFLKSASRRGDVIFVGTKRQACDLIVETAMECGAHYVANRWAGGLLTNYSVLRKSLKAFTKLERDLSVGVENRTKQEIAWMKKDFERYQRLYEGVKHLSSKPTAIVVIDAKREHLAIHEARKAGIPVVALADTNADPDVIDYIVPGNDDAISSIGLFLKYVGKAILEGNEGKRLAAIRKSYEAELAQAKSLSIAEKEKKLLEKKMETEERTKLREGSVVRIVEKAQEEPKKITVKKEVKVQEKKTLSSLNLSARTEKALESAELDYEKLVKMSSDELRSINGVGPKAVEEIQKALSK